MILKSISFFMHIFCILISDLYFIIFCILLEFRRLTQSEILYLFKVWQYMIKFVYSRKAFLVTRVWHTNLLQVPRKIGQNFAYQVSACTRSDFSDFYPVNQAYLFPIRNNTSWAVVNSAQIWLSLIEYISWSRATEKARFSMKPLKKKKM